MVQASNFERVKGYNLLKKELKEFERKIKSLDNQNRILEHFHQLLPFF